MKAKNSVWQWPNILGVDAAFIAMGWQWVFATQAGVELKPATSIVLGLSVWLTYLADRLFDVAQRPSEHLLSRRHQFAKQHTKPLWLLWALVLATNIATAFLSLNATQLRNGFILLGICLLYTAFNQILSKRFFPKELLVALIFAAGTQIFLPERTDVFAVFSFALLCLANCLVIAHKERTVDAQLRVSSLTSVIKEPWSYAILAIGLAMALARAHPIALVSSICLLILLQVTRARLEIERFRILCDTALLAGPIIYFFFGSGVLVK